jgi:ADP-heptose:LPS heptosyltransferase
LKILVIRFSSIGDIVLTTPVVRCLKEQLSCEVHYCTKAGYKSILENNPYIDKLHLLDDNMKELTKSLKNEKFDYVIDLHRNIRTMKIKWSLMSKWRSVDKLNIEKWMLVKFKTNRLPKVHIVDRYLETTRSLGVKNDGKGLDYFISEKDEMKMDELPEGFQNGFNVFAVGGQHFTKKLPNERIAEAIDKVSYPTILLGGKEDYENGEEIVKMSNSVVVNFCGKSSLGESAWLVKMSERVFTHDTGVMHIAAAFNKPIVSFWGNTVPQFGMYPYLVEEKAIEKSKMIEVTDLPCRPCSKIGFDKCPQGHFKCMKESEFNF